MSKKTAKQILPFVLLAVVAIAAMFIKPAADFVPAADGPQYSNADIAWVLVSTALVFLMTVINLCNKNQLYNFLLLFACQNHNPSIDHSLFHSTTSLLKMSWFVLTSLQALLVLGCME